MSALPKDTSWHYGPDCQRNLLEKYFNRANNHWRNRIDLAHRLLQQYALPRFKKPRSEIVTVDVGCAIGTFAIEMAKQGFKSYGIDFDPAAIQTAQALSAQESVSPTFVCGDVSDWKNDFPAIDIAICFDIFEHLHDDELGAFLVGIRKQLSERGCLVFHTYPMEGDHLFYSRLPVVLVLVPFAWLPVPIFNRIAKTYSATIDLVLSVIRGQTWRETQFVDPHCNVLSKERLSNIFKRTGWEFVTIESAQLFPMFARRAKWFAKQPLAHRNLFGVAVPRKHRPQG